MRGAGRESTEPHGNGTKDLERDNRDMAAQLIQTNFTYNLNGREVMGSYLGRKPASRDTINRFLAANHWLIWGAYLPYVMTPSAPKVANVLTSFPSAYIAR